MKNRQKRFVATDPNQKFAIRGTTDFNAITELGGGKRAAYLSARPAQRISTSTERAADAHGEV